MSAQPEGIDISTVGQGVINWSAVSGVDWLYAKASQSTNFTDPNFTRNRQGAAAAGIISGAYHYWRPDTDPRAQMYHFADVYGVWRPGDLPPCLDVELDPGEFTGMSAAQLVAHVTACLDIMEQLCGKRPVIYTYPAFWRERMGNTTSLSQYPLWIAAYPGPPPRIGGWGGNYVMHQYTDRGSVPGIPHVDRDHFNGSMADLKAFCGIVDTPPAPSSRFYPETGHTVRTGFLEYFDKNGGVAQFGYPLTEERAGSDGTWSGTEQVFERAVFQYHTEVQPPQVMLRNIGAEWLTIHP
jgi:GH25 family lysozyme M1 (1,4-beta-N-acetylmuramidase)